MNNLIDKLANLGYVYASSEKQKKNETFIFRSSNGSEIDVYTVVEENSNRRVKRAQFKKSGDKFFSQLRITEEMTYAPCDVVEEALKRINKVK